MKKFILTGLVALLALGIASTANANVFFGLRGGAEKLKIENTSVNLDEGQTDFLFGAFVGYHYSFFRLEGEYTFHPERRYQGKTTKIEDNVAMGNLYFSPPIRSFFHPYIMGGAGCAFHDMSVGTNSNKSKSFAWQAGIGLELEFTENVFLDVGGRYSDYGKAEIGNQKYDLKAYSYFGGLRFEY
ncbi:MAG: porin family protein [Alphaproteobacteria bacterium]|nr:porin family protein [Alphaproteobacteria bacterium]